MNCEGWRNVKMLPQLPAHRGGDEGGTICGDRARGTDPMFGAGNAGLGCEVGCWTDGCGSRGELSYVKQLTLDSYLTPGYHGSRPPAWPPL